jgi:hypothetical protein
MLGCQEDQNGAYIQDIDDEHISRLGTLDGNGSAKVVDAAQVHVL